MANDEYPKEQGLGGNAESDTRSNNKADQKIRQSRYLCVCIVCHGIGTYLQTSSSDKIKEKNNTEKV